jgi:glycogen debranching enzyme GlgX
MPSPTIAGSSNWGLRNYWGYNSICFFSPHPEYLNTDQSISPFKVMVRRLHAAGIEVILDVVYNHTAEGNEMGPTVSFRGIDNASYYMLAEDRRYYHDVTGCGNSMNLSHPRVLQMVADSLRYWVTEMGVDGFRFDLATTLGRDKYGFNPGASFFDMIRQDPILSRVKLIAEPWDTGPMRATGSAATAPAGRSGTTAIAIRCGPSGAATKPSAGTRRPASRLQRPVRAPGAQVLGQHQLHHRP